MSLEKYAKKRDFTKTTEPKAGKSKDKDKLMFVIQKHDASRLHYDFRLEMDGVLKSWAVPKGPSTDPKNKRLAMMVEDHPFDYRNFEGIIPQGEYGGGTVIVWDEGTYEPIEEIKGKKAQEKHLLKQLKEGSLKIKLHGEKLEGEYALVKTHGMGENGWLLIKHKDDFASTTDITKKDRSVRSGKTIEKMEKTSEKVWKDGEEQDVEDEQPKKKASSKKKLHQPIEELSDEAEETPAGKKTDTNAILKKAPKGKVPTGIKPMLATLVNEPFDDPDWIYEVKWDGYRTLGFINKGEVQLLSRNNKDFNEKYYPLKKLLESWKLNAVVDGEILVLNDKGVSNFGALQNWRSEADGELVLYIFDLLWYEGKNLMELPLAERQAVMKEVIPTDDDRIRLSQTFKANGTEFFEAAGKLGLEGIMAKRASSTYLTNNRSKDWLKIKINKRQEVVIGGFTKNAGTAKQFSSLLLGVYEDGKFQYVGKVGTGFSDKLQKEMMAMFEPLIVDKVPFTSEPDVNKPSRFRPNPPRAKATWLKPQLVCEVSFAEVTSDGVFRHPSFEGMRVDKKAKDIVRETEADTAEMVEEDKPKAPKEPVTAKHKLVNAPKETVKRTLLNPKEETQVKKICGHDLKFTHLSKVYWPEDSITKRDMFNYYYQVAEYILPYLKDRPQSLNRFPNGIHGPSFYQKDVRGKSPDWVRTFPYTTSEGEDKDYLVGHDEATLLWMASLGCIEMNPWFSRIQSPDNPDYCIIDLDPDKNTFDQVIEAAQEVKKVLDAIDVPGYCKTSGSTGMHIYIPLGAQYDYDQSQMFARLIVNIVHRQIPDYTSLERMVKNRDGKMYLDFLQNRPGATIAGPYSLRPKPGATVSMPLHWDEVKPGLTMKDFTIHNAVDRLKTEGDLFKGVLDKGINLEKTIKKAQSIFK
ncbi:DNA ligase D [Mucilaginibacter phyllosphaerae]|uniref:DNA ligase (ATP) n=1 Tax=Mucilaginibacter phyllosphaerae TaxID=1812349 RepID=A0A4Y8AE98_9SPHI|nr:DNA ligase D [Mucilaginibacter phyllosphaerae]MBB3970125.1 bifunctional non-homologous end joining protein LigD [Mucilaginibacter phyllosphaerae]TEW66512.1 DNA ligase D [Mucilaginibacter phyllosphaerae]GGH09926.1 ATP-dependent DNA ligase [Mucilaginibacter phyllosphaerae]